MASISLLNPKAEFARAAQALAINISAAKGLQDVMRTNLGPKGTMKMYVLNTFSDLINLQKKFKAQKLQSTQQMAICVGKL